MDWTSKKEKEKMSKYIKWSKQVWIVHNFSDRWQPCLICNKWQIHLIMRFLTEDTLID